MQLATAQHQDLKEAIRFLEQEEDFVSRDLVQALHEDVEEYIHWLGDQQNFIEQMGLENYLQSLLD